MMPPCFTSEETELQKGQARRFIVLSMEFPASLVCDSVMVLAFRRSLWFVCVYILVSHQFLISWEKALGPVCFHIIMEKRMLWMTSFYLRLTPNHEEGVRSVYRCAYRWGDRCEVPCRTPPLCRRGLGCEQHGCRLRVPFAHTHALGKTDARAPGASAVQGL